MGSVTDIILDIPWSNIRPGQRVRWATPRFIKYGVVQIVDGRSMRLQFDDEDRPRNLPDAKWYFVEGKRDPNGDEHMVVIDSSIPTEAIGFIKGVEKGLGWMSTEQACEYLNWDGKKLRRFIRQERIVAFKRGDRWFIHREKLKEQAAKHGWV